METARFSPRLKLIAAREATGLDRPAFAEKIGRSRSYVWRCEMGQYDTSLSTIAVWLRALERPAEFDLFEPHPRVRALVDFALRELNQRAAA